jgi:hypothetical protein
VELTWGRARPQGRVQSPQCGQSGGGCPRGGGAGRGGRRQLRAQEAPAVEEDEDMERGDERGVVKRPSPPAPPATAIASPRSCTEPSDGGRPVRTTWRHKRYSVRGVSFLDLDAMRLEVAIWCFLRGELERGVRPALLLCRLCPRRAR